MSRLLSRLTASNPIRSAFRPATPAWKVIPRAATMATSGKTDNKDLRANALFDVSHITAVVTGGGTGIGLMITQALQANGANVYITGRRRDVLEKTAALYGGAGPGSIHALPGDISAKDETLRLAREVEAREPGGIQLLVNNAGIARDDDTRFAAHGQPDMTDAAAISAHFLRSTEAQWADTMRTNVAAQYFMSMAFLPLLARGSGGSSSSSSSSSSQIVNVSSISGAMRGTSAGQPAYAASKAALTHLSRMLATTLKDVPVRVNVIAPGVFPSEMTAGGRAADDNKSALDEAAMKPTNPSGRFGRDEDMAATILFLAGRSGQWYNGQILYPDGGSTIIQPAVNN